MDTRVLGTIVILLRKSSTSCFRPGRQKLCIGVLIETYFGAFQAWMLSPRRGSVDVRRQIHVAGLGTKRAIQVVQTARRLVADFGTEMRCKLRTMSPDETYVYLVSLPGIGPKSALCVMMYSLDMDVFPVDANIHRIVERLGAIRKGYTHRYAQKAIPRLVPAGESRNLHVGLVVHGRRTCLPRNPRCDTCMLRDVCRTGKRKPGGAFTSRHNSASAKVG